MKRINRLYAAAQFLAQTYLNITYPDKPNDDVETFITGLTEKESAIEHVCHELGHATLLGLQRRKNLHGTIAAALRNESRAYGALNETQTFSVVIGVLRKFGIKYCRNDALAACDMQVNLGHEEIAVIWRRFARTKKRRNAVRSVVAAFNRVK